MGKKSIWCMGLVLGLATMSVGCFPSIPLPGVEVARNVQYDDIPVPLGFEYDDNKSWAYLRFEEGPVAMRSCEFVYWGDRPLTDLASWYLEQMRLEGWAHDRTDEHGDISLHFSKNRESAEIYLERAVNDRREGYITKLTARIGAK